MKKRREVKLRGVAECGHVAPRRQRPRGRWTERRHHDARGRQQRSQRAAVTHGRHQAVRRRHAASTWAPWGPAPAPWPPARSQLLQRPDHVAVPRTLRWWRLCWRPVASSVAAWTARRRGQRLLRRLQRQAETSRHGSSGASVHNSTARRIRRLVGGKKALQSPAARGERGGCECVWVTRLRSGPRSSAGCV